MKFWFSTTQMKALGEHRFEPFTIHVEADTVEEAWKQAEPQIPPDAKLFCWWSDAKGEEE